MYSLDDTIVAIASPPGGAARGIVRISGPTALECTTRFFRADNGQAANTVRMPQAVAGSLRLPELHSPLPCDAYFWPTQGYTGQPVVELHTLGSPPLVQMVLRAVCAAGARLAEPGEFTMRAFLAGRIDLTQAEAVLGVIDAGDARELDVALGQLAGGLARPLQRLREDMLDLLVHLEAGFDFADEDIELITRDELSRRLDAAASDVAAIRQQASARNEAVHAVRAVLVGRPNTGKSSLFNALAADRAALVSDRPGTTRDYLSVELDLDGVKCQLIDTAGASNRLVSQPPSVDRLGATAGLSSSAENTVGQANRGTRHFRSVGALETGPEAIENAAHNVSNQQRRSAHITLFCLDSTRPLDAWEQDQLSGEGEKLVVLTKCDAPQQTDFRRFAIETSSVTGHGIAKLRSELHRLATLASGHHGEIVAGTAVRCADSLRLAGHCLERARDMATAGREELVAAEVRVALEELGRVVGAVYTDDVLDHIFSRFCVGK